MRVSKDIWLERMGNLNRRRSSGTIKNSVAGVDDYRSHIYKGWIGRTVLDVGCGDMKIKKYLPKDCTYCGIDPFPVADGAVKTSIEQCVFAPNSFETVYCFAMLDNVYDLPRAIDNIKRIAAKNVLILTGVNITPDEYHTIYVTEEMLNELFYGFEITYKEYLHPKILLIEYTK